MAQLSRFLDAIIDSIVLFRDYFIVRKHITLSEAFLFCLAFIRAIWFTIFGVQLGPNPGPLTHEAWTPVFWVISMVHLVSFFLAGRRLRIASIGLYAFLWCFVALLVAMTSFSSPALPTFFMFSLLSVFLTVRLMRDRQT